MPKKGSFLNIQFTQQGDSAVGTAAMPVLGKVDFRGIFDKNNNRIEGAFLKAGKAVALITGHPFDTTRNYYESLYPQIMALAQAPIYSPALLQISEWKTFSGELKSLTKKAHDDMELFLGFSLNSQKLHFSHFNLVMHQDNSESTEDISVQTPDVIFEEKDLRTGYVKINNFSSIQEKIQKIFPSTVSGNYQNLIVDLRGNPGGGLEAALEMAKYVLKDSVLIGYFPTNKFLPAARDVVYLSQLPLTTATTTEAFIEEMNTTAGKTLTAPKPQNEVFQGRLYILTNNKTASTCEPIVYVLKNKQGATVVGQATAGAMLSASYFTIEGKYKLVLPVADFYDYDGRRLEKSGVEPNIAAPAGEDALTKVMAQIAAGRE